MPEALAGFDFSKISVHADGSTARPAGGLTDVAKSGEELGGSGAPLPGPLQQKFRALLGADLTGVRVHTGAESDAAAAALNARAYTVGQDIHFAAGRYHPESTSGERLLAHEVAHAVQQAEAPSVQPGTEVSRPGDAAEAEADRAADAIAKGEGAAVSRTPAQIAREPEKPEGDPDAGAPETPIGSDATGTAASDPTQAVQRKCAACAAGLPCTDSSETERLQRSTADATATAGVARYGADLGAGRPLDNAARAFFEPRFGHDFSRVRVHDTASAAASARSVNALAYTTGRDVVFGAGRFAPGTDEGRRLLAHELAHVVQQEEGPVDGTPASFRGVQLSDPSDRFEREADRIAERILHMKNLPSERASPWPQGAAALATSSVRPIQREPEDLDAAPQPGPDAEPMQTLKPGVCNHPHAVCSAADTLTGEAVVCAAKRAGFTGKSLTTAVAVARAESGWDRCCYSSTADLGLWQINKVNWKSFGGRDALYDADTNARAAFSLSSSGKSFKAWNAFKNGSYAKFLKDAQDAVDSAKCDVKPDAGQTGDSQPPAEE